MTTITLKGKPLKTIGNLPAIGSQIPDLALTKTDLSETSLKDYLGKKVILNIFPSVDTPTCAAAERRFNEMASTLNNVVVLCISADLPFAQARFCGAENLKNVTSVSTFRHPESGKKLGVTITEGGLSGLLSRAVIILDEKSKVIYSEQVAELDNEPNYTAALAALK